MKKFTIQIILKVFAVLLIVMTVASFSTMVRAAEIDPSKDLTENYAGDTTTLTAKVGNVMGVIRNIAVIASVIVLMVIGVKYILGSVEEKAEYKKTFMPLIIGIIIVVSATSIAAFIFNAVK